MTAAEAQKLSFEYQEKLGEVTKYLFFLGESNIVANRTVVREIEMRLKGASEAEISSLAKQELINVVKQLKDQEDMAKNKKTLCKKLSKFTVRLMM